MTSDKLEYLNETKLEIKEALNKKLNPEDKIKDNDTFRSYASKPALIPSGGEVGKIVPKTITQNGVYNASEDEVDGYNPITVDVPSGGGTGEWTRPTDRPDVPTVNDNEAYYLFKVIPNAINDMCLQFTFTGNALVNWGDGIVETLTSNVKLDHLYNFDSIDVPINADGSKWIWIKVYSEDGDITLIPLARSANRPVGRPASNANNRWSPNVFEMYINIPNGALSGSTTVSETYNAYVLCEYIKIYNWAQTSFNGMFYNYHKLKVVECPDIIGNCPSMMCNCYNLQKIVTPSGVIDSTSSLGLLSNCYQLRELELSGNYYTGSSNSNLINNSTEISRALEKVRIHNMHINLASVDVSLSKIDRKNMIQLFNDLSDRTDLTAGTIKIIGTSVASQLTAEDIAIATAKNWTVTGWVGY